MSSPSWKPGRRHGIHATRSPKHACVEGFAVGRGRKGDARVGMQVVHIRGIDEAVHRRIDGRGSATATEQAEVEGAHHLVLALDAGVDLDERAKAIESQNGKAVLGERGQITTRALDPQQVDGASRDRIGRGPLR